MLLYLPVRWDANEWYVVLNAVFGYTWAFFVPKRYPRCMTVLVVLFTVSSAIMMDHAIASAPLDLYDINDRPVYELMDVFSYFMYAPYTLLCVYLYDKFDPKGLGFTAYVLGWSLLCTGFEWLAVICHVFKFRQWNLFYSFNVYMVMTTILLLFFRWLKRHFDDRTLSVSKSKTAE